MAQKFDSCTSLIQPMLQQLVRFPLRSEGFNLKHGAKAND